MGIRVVCRCGFTEMVPDQFAGSVGKCPHCGEALLVPGSPATAGGAGPSSDADPHSGDLPGEFRAASPALSSLEAARGELPPGLRSVYRATMIGMYILVGLLFVAWLAMAIRIAGEDLALLLFVGLFWLFLQVVIIYHASRFGSFSMAAIVGGSVGGATLAAAALIWAGLSDVLFRTHVLAFGVFSLCCCGACVVLMLRPPLRRIEYSRPLVPRVGGAVLGFLLAPLISLPGYLGFMPLAATASLAWGGHTETALRKQQKKKCESNLRRLADAIDTYMGTHGGQLPAHLSDLVDARLIDEDSLYCPAKARYAYYGREIGEVLAVYDEGADSLDRVFGHSNTDQVRDLMIVSESAADNHGDGYIHGISLMRWELTLKPEDLEKTLAEPHRRTLDAGCEKHREAIVEAITVYAKSHDDHLPDSLDDLVRAGLIRRDYLVCPFAAERGDTARATYRYLGSSLYTLRGASPDRVLLYEPLAAHGTEGYTSHWWGFGELWDVVGNKRLQELLEEQRQGDVVLRWHVSMKRVVDALKAYAGKHAGALPEDLSALVAEGLVDEGSLSCPLCLAEAKRTGGDPRAAARFWYLGNLAPLAELEGDVPLVGDTSHGGMPGQASCICVDGQRRPFAADALRHQQCRINLGRIGVALKRYAESHDGRLPPTLQTLADEGLVAADCLVCPAHLAALGPGAADTSAAQYCYLASLHDTPLTPQEARRYGLGSDNPSRWLVVDLPVSGMLKPADQNVYLLKDDGSVSGQSYSSVIRQLDTLCSGKRHENLMAVQKALLKYAAAHGNRLPITLDELVSDGLLRAGQLQYLPSVKDLSPGDLHLEPKSFVYCRNDVRTSDRWVDVVAAPLGEHDPRIEFVNLAGQVMAKTPQGGKASPSAGQSQTAEADCLLRMRKVHSALLRYAADHGGCLPADLNALVAEKLAGTEELICPLPQDAAAPGTAGQAAVRYWYIGVPLPVKSAGDLVYLACPNSAGHGYARPFQITGCDPAGLPKAMGIDNIKSSIRKVRLRAIAAALAAYAGAHNGCLPDALAALERDGYLKPEMFPAPFPHEGLARYARRLDCVTYEYFMAGARLADIPKRMLIVVDPGTPAGAQGNTMALRAPDLVVKMSDRELNPMRAMANSWRKTHPPAGSSSP